MIHLLEVMIIMGILAQIKKDSGPTYASKKIKQFFPYCNRKHITGISHNSIGQTALERSNRPIKDMSNKLKGMETYPQK